MFRNILNGFKDIISPNIKSEKRILLVLIMIIIFLAASSFFIYMKFLNSALEDKICENMLITIEQLKANLDYRFNQVVETGKTGWAFLYNFVSSGSDRETELKEYREIMRLLASYEGRYMIKSMHLYVPDEKFYSVQRDNIYPLSALKDTVYVQHPGTYWIGVHQIRNSALTYMDVISCAISISSKFDYKAVAGVLFLNISASDIMETIDLEYENAHIYFCESDGKLIATDDPAKMIGDYAFTPEQMENIKKTQSGFMPDGRDSILIFSRLETTDWYLVLSIAKKELNSYSSFDLNIIRAIYAVVILAVFIVLLFAAYAMIIKRTINNINKSLMEINPALNFYDIFKSQSDKNRVKSTFSALYTLDLSVRHMVKEVKSLLEEQYKTELAAKEYQMQALQAQIKPHFLYNTLDTIVWLIKEKDINGSIWMINNLSKYLRGSINKGVGYVTLNEELELAKVYISIMKKRFSNSFDVEFIVSSESLKCYIPKLTLQPFIENALIHGLLHCEKEGKKLSVRACVTDDMLEVEIEDNGRGMSKETLEQLNRLKERARDGNKSYGIINVYKRLQLFSKGKLLFNINSAEGMGTCVTISLPAVTDPDISGYEQPS